MILNINIEFSDITYSVPYSVFEEIRGKFQIVVNSLIGWNWKDQTVLEALDQSFITLCQYHLQPYLFNPVVIPDIKISKDFYQDQEKISILAQISGQPKNNIIALTTCHICGFGYGNHSPSCSNYTTLPIPESSSPQLFIPSEKLKVPELEKKEEPKKDVLSKVKRKIDLD